MKKTKRELAFTKANKARKRVIIAKDVLEQIRIGRYEPTKGTYIAVDDEFQEFKITDRIQKAIKKTKTCRVCALGSVFMSGIGIGNDLKFSDNEYSDPDLFGYSNLGEVRDNDDFMRESLSKYFDSQQLEDIERAFEYWPMKGVSGSYFPYFDMYGGGCGWEQYDDTSRLAIIMINIIKNQGTFVFDPPYAGEYDHLIEKYIGR